MPKAGQPQAATSTIKRSQRRSRWPAAGKSGPPPTVILLLYRCHTCSLGPDVGRRKGLTGPYSIDPSFEGRALVLVPAGTNSTTTRAALKAHPSEA